jgi:ribosome-binding protein aMBF1 (putative translation factor)
MNQFEIDKASGLIDSEIQLNHSEKTYLEDAQERAETFAWRKESMVIAVQILTQLEVLGLNQSDLAKRMGITRQAVNKYVSGRCNFTLEQRHKLQAVLGVNLGLLPDNNTKTIKVA